MKKAVGYIGTVLAVLFIGIVGCAAEPGKGSSAAKDIRKISDILYAEKINDQRKHQELYLDVFVPAGNCVRNSAAVILFHGGGLRRGTRDSHTQIAEALCRRGYVVVSADYRLRTNLSADIRDSIRDAVSDGVDAIDFVRNKSSEYGIDENNLFIGGDSAGGYIASYIGYMDEPAALVSKRKSIRGIIDIYGGNIPVRPDKGEPSILIIHGDADEMVDYQDSLSLIRKCKEAGIYTELFTMEGEGHSYKNYYFDRVIGQIDLFMRKTRNTKDSAPSK